MALVVCVCIAGGWAVNHWRADARLTQLGRAASTIEVSYTRHGAEQLPALVERFKKEGGLSYCAIVGIDGRYLAHTSPSEIGKSAEQFTGERSQWGEATSVTYTNAQGDLIAEYQVPLNASRTTIGSLRTGAMAPSLSRMLPRFGSIASLALLAPLFWVAGGAIVLTRQIKPVAEVESELREIARSPSGASPEMKLLTPASASAIGWNRLVNLITELRNNVNLGDAETRLQRKASLLNSEGADTVLQHLPEGYAITDGDGRVTTCNPAMAALLGRHGEIESIQNAAFIDLLPDPCEIAAWSELTEDSSRQRPMILESQIIQNDFERFLRVARYPRRSETGDLLGHIWNIRDITQQKLVERTRDQFIDTATHELRTPLSNIKAYAETLTTMDSLDVEQQKEFCNTINSEATRLARFVDELLEISSMEAGAMTLEKQNVELSRLFAEVVDKVEPLANNKTLDFQVTLPAKLPEYPLDKDKFVASLVNLLGNAVKYTPAGGRVSLSVTSSSDLLQIEIEDTGVGISEEELPRIFDKFFRSSDARVAEQVGTGLGLSIAAEVIRLHGGELQATSELDQGSTFKISLPQLAS